MILEALNICTQTLSNKSFGYDYQPSSVLEIKNFAKDKKFIFIAESAFKN